MIPDISIGEIALRLVIAAALSGLVGLEREWRERAAGLRTHMLVGVGSALFTLISAYGFNDFLVGGSNVVRADPSRIAAQIVTGIGFLGAGAIMLEREEEAKAENATKTATRRRTTKKKTEEAESESS